MAQGDYTFYTQRWFTNRATDVDFAATDGGKDNVVVVRSANHQIFIQKISYNPVTAAAQAVTFQDDAMTPVKIATVPASQSTPMVFDFGPKGVALSVGKNLDITNTAGPAAKIHIEAYERLRTDAGVALASTN